MTEFHGFAEMERNGWADAETAASYARDFGRAADQCIPTIVRLSGAAAGARVLDLCCGPGNVTQGLLAAGATVTALDFSDAMLRLARKHAPDAQFLQGDAAQTGLPAHSFDAVTIGLGIPHLPDPAAVLREAHRLLKPDGVLVFSVWDRPTPGSGFGLVFDAVAAHGDPDLALPPGPDAHEYADPDFAFPVLRSVGFSHCEREVVSCAWDVDDAAAPFNYFLNGTVRGGALLRPQPPQRKRAIRADVAARVKAHLGPVAPWHIPVPAAIISARA